MQWAHDVVVVELMLVVVGLTGLIDCHAELKVELKETKRNQPQMFVNQLFDRILRVNQKTRSTIFSS